MSEETTEAPTTPEEATGPKWSMARTSVVLVVAGVIAMVLPGLLRDGLCGLVACADVTPDVAVGRAEGVELAVVMSDDAASEVLSVRLFEVRQPDPDSDRDVLNGDWIIQRTDESAAPSVIPLGSQPDGFETLTELAEDPLDGTWVLDASFGCASTLTRFAPTDLNPGFVTEGEEPVPVQEFTDSASSDLRCAEAPPGWQRWLFIGGALMASIGAVLGIVVVFRRPVGPPPDWYDDQDPV
ncbi:MAG: hypothetical protein ACR2OH_05785 [Microthrixaceae bacterium]